MNLRDYLNRKGRGALASMAHAINAHAPDVSRWSKGSRLCPPWRCIDIENYTAGEVSRKDLRPLDYAKFWPELDKIGEAQGDR